MREYYDAFEMSPVPDAGPDAVAPEPFRGIYPMPMFVTIPTSNLTASVDFWVRGIGFIDLFSIPGHVTHLRRWAFQDVLLVPGDIQTASVGTVSVSFSCVLNEIDGIAEACEAQLPGCTEGPRRTPWNTIDVDVITPENARVIITAAKPYDPSSQEARDLAEVGITGPQQ